MEILVGHCVGIFFVMFNCLEVVFVVMVVGKSDRFVIWGVVRLYILIGFICDCGSIVFVEREFV